MLTHAVKLRDAWAARVVAPLKVPSNGLYAHSRNIRNLCLKIRKLHVNGIRSRLRTRVRIIQRVSVQDFRPSLWHGRKPGGAMKIVAEYEIRESEVEVVEKEKQPWH